MTLTGERGLRWRQSVAILSLLLIFFTIPHTLEDFAYGEPAEAGIPVTVLSLVASVVFFVQAVGLYWLGRGQRRGVVAHLVVGLFWPVGSGFAQLPDILGGAPYRAGFVSVLYVIGMIVVGLLLLVAAAVTLARRDT